jgi:hypothetical protein
VCGARQRPGWRTTAVVAAWILAVPCFLGGAGAAFATLTFPQALAQHPIPATATVTDHFIDGFGGDPNVNYRYSVKGRTYNGYGTGALGGTYALDLHVGDPVPIVYARDSPGASCTCDPSGRSGRAYLPLDAVFMAPLFALIFGTVRRRRVRHRLAA